MSYSYHDKPLHKCASCGKPDAVKKETSSCRSCTGRKNATKHGMRYAPEYSVWQSMIERCRYPSQVSYKRYGAMGIAVCDRWLDFTSFYSDMGERPSSDHQLDRIDNRKGYEPGNCRWVTRKENMNNKTNHRVIEWRGEALNLSQWAERTGLAREAIAGRLNAGWEVERALTQPSRKRSNALG